MGVGGQLHVPAALLPGKTRYPLYRRLGGNRNGLDGCRHSRPPPGFDPRTAQAVASRYTDYAIPAPAETLDNPKGKGNGHSTLWSVWLWFFQNVVTFLPKHTASFFVFIILQTAPQALVKTVELCSIYAALYSVTADWSVPRAVFCVSGLLQARWTKLPCKLLCRNCFYPRHLVQLPAYPRKKT